MPNACVCIHVTQSCTAGAGGSTFQLCGSPLPAGSKVIKVPHLSQLTSFKKQPCLRHRSERLVPAAGQRCLCRACVRLCETERGACPEVPVQNQVRGLQIPCSKSSAARKFHWQVPLHAILDCLLAGLPVACCCSSHKAHGDRILWCRWRCTGQPASRSLHLAPWLWSSTRGLLAGKTSVPRVGHDCCR